MVHVQRAARGEPRARQPVELDGEQVLGQGPRIGVRVDDDRRPAPGVAAEEGARVGRGERAGS